MLQWLGRLFGGGGGSSSSGRSADGGIYIRVRCDACGEILTARINPNSELSLQDSGQGYYVRKVLVGQQCYRPVELQVWYADLGGRETNREVRGGSSVT